MYEFNIRKQTITIEGDTYMPYDFNTKGIPAFAGKSEFHYKLFLFLCDWYSKSPFLKVQTSGSTGTPKEIVVEKSRMMNSAEMTCRYFGLKEKDKSLLCMPLDYIAGKMVTVRALIAGMDLHPVPPSGNPLKNNDVSFRFAAMTPMQVYNSLQTDIETKRLSQIKKLIIGGGAIDNSLLEILKELPNDIYSTYGMTETLSHIAIRALNGDFATDYYYPLQNVSVKLSEEGTLIIDAPKVSAERLETNDIAEINKDGGFRILGRKDNVINTGGVKVHAEEVEALLKPLIKGNFAITSLPDEKFGEIVVLLTEEDVDESLFAGKLPPYSTPKKIIKVDTIPLTETGKIKRSH
ncbi:AMP-binding protein [Dysgonomonas sp. 511]|uniref:AMP-binding protein n=1 Tax=Dysgonomonas sp. 511 TaxID=2302930 RepID=UPI0013D0FA3A|nr:AMP-binding protein [Dysgonomonas sp. 511]NDV80159.1 O-succinylbenzoic acid--CoA ligase [Dysgonomonas sp. 511]